MFSGPVFHGLRIVGVTSAVAGALVVCGFIATAAAQEQDEVDQAALREFNATAALQNSGFYARAAEKWDAFIKKYPQDKRLDRVHYYLGICQLHTKKHDDAVKTFQSVLSKYPQFESADGAQFNLSMAYFEIAELSGKPEEYKRAADAFAVVATKYPQSKQAHKALYFQGESLYQAGDKAAAATAYQNLIKTYPDSSLLAESYYYLGTTQQELAQEAEASATFQSFLNNAKLAEHERAPEIRLRLGISQYNQKKFDEADKLFAACAALSEFPLADFALLRQAQCRVETGKPDEAVTILVGMLTKFPESQYKSAAQLAAGKCYYSTDKLDDAQKMLAPVVAAKTPESPEASYWLGRTLLKQKKPKEALALLEPAVSANTDANIGPYLEIARLDALYDLPERRKETPPLYDAFAKKYPDHQLASSAVYMAALSSLENADYANARTHAEAFLANAAFAQHELRPAVLFIAAEGYLLPTTTDGQGDVAKAEQLYRQLVTQHSEHERVPRANLRIGWCLYQAKKYAESVQYLTQTMAKLDAPEERAEAQLLIGRSQSAAGNEKEAVAAYDAALAAKPDWPRSDEVLLAASQSLRNLDDLNGAQQRLAQLKSKYPQSEFAAQATYLLGEIAQEQDKPDEAIQHFRLVQQQFAQSEFATPANYGLAGALFAKQDYQNALAPLNQLLATANIPPELASRGQYLRGMVYQRLKQFEPAIKDLQTFIAGKPEGDLLYDARYNLALCQVGLKQFDQASATLAALAAEKPDYAHADKVYYELGHALLEQKKPAEAVVAFRTLAEKLPDSDLAPEGWFHVGRFHEEASDGAEADADKMAEATKAAVAFTAGLQKAKTPELREKLQYKLGDMQFRQKQYAEATATLLAQLKEYPQGELAGPAQFLAAESLFRQNEFQQAMPLFVQVATAKVEPYHAQSLYRAGTCAANLKNWPESQRHYDALIKLFPKFEQISEARYGMGLAMQNQNQLAQARTVYEQVTQETETETAAKARFMIGEIAFAEKKYEEAIEHYLLVAVGYPYKEWQALAQFEAGRCLIELGRKDKAIETLQVIVDKFPDHAKAKDAATLIAELKK